MSYLDKNSTTDEVIAEVAKYVASFHSFVEFYRDWAARRHLPEVEEHMLRAEAEVREALTILVTKERIEQ